MTTQTTHPDTLEAREATPQAKPEPAPASAFNNSGVQQVDGSHVPANTREGDPIFTIATRVLVYLIVLATLTVGVTPIASLPISLALIALLALARRERMALSFLIFYGILFAIYAGMFIGNLHFFIFSAPRIFQMIGQMPTVVAFFFIVTAPPGLLSAALARIHIPKKIIIGVLVIVRFFPTVASFWRRYRDAVRMRGLLTFSATIRNPLAALEYVIVPVMLSLATSADQLSTSAIARAAEAPGRRTSYYRQPMRVRDGLAVLTIAAICAGCLWWGNGVTL